jgi:archaellum biogenesis protein FlaJ (TadC family)
MLVYGLMPATILLPLSAIFFPGNFVIAIVLFIYTNAVIGSLYSSAIFSVYHQDELKKSVHDDAYRIEIEILGELWLTLGRVLSIIPLLMFFYLGHSDWMLPLVVGHAITIPIVVALTYKSATSLARDKR